MRLHNTVYLFGNRPELNWRLNCKSPGQLLCAGCIRTEHIQILKQPAGNFTR
jgi:hypothetical protein